MAACPDAQRPGTLHNQSFDRVLCQVSITQWKARVSNHQERAKSAMKSLMTYVTRNVRSGELYWVPIDELFVVGLLVDVRPPDAVHVEQMADNIKKTGFDEASAVSIWRNVVVDGYLGWAAAVLAGLEYIPVVELEFESERQAFHHAIRCEAVRRVLTDAQLAKLFESVDQPIRRGGRRNRARQLSIAANVAIARSSQRTAYVLNTSPGRIETLRVIRRRHPELFEEIKQGELSIRFAARLARSDRSNQPNMQSGFRLNRQPSLEHRSRLERLVRERAMAAWLANRVAHSNAEIHGEHRPEDPGLY